MDTVPRRHDIGPGRKPSSARPLNARSWKAPAGVWGDTAKASKAGSPGDPMHCLAPAEFYWTHATSKIGAHPPAPARGGECLTFLHVRDLDDIWPKTRGSSPEFAHESGRLETTQPLPQHCGKHRWRGVAPSPHAYRLGTGVPGFRGPIVNGLPQSMQELPGDAWTTERQTAAWVRVQNCEPTRANRPRSLRHPLWSVAATVDGSAP